MIGYFLGVGIRGSDQTFTTAQPATSFTSWAEIYFTPTELQDANVSGPNAIFGSDGLTNLIKYALGLDPTLDAVSGLPETSVVATDWVYTYTRPADRPDLSYAVEVSTNLTSWTTTGVAMELVTSSGANETWRAKYPLASAANVFFRLKVTQN